MDHLKRKEIRISQIGYPKSRIIKLYNSGKTFKDLENNVGRKVKPIVSRRDFKNLIEYWDVTLRSKAENTKIRNSRQSASKRGRTFSEEKIIHLYSVEKESIKEISRQSKFAPQTIRKILSENGVEVRQQVEIKQILEDINRNGLPNEKIKDLYLDENLSRNQLISEIEKFTTFKITRKRISKILKKIDLEKKTPEQMKNLQGLRSRAEKARNLEKFSRTGFGSFQEVADFYVENEHLTKSSLVDLLNKNLGELDEKFTVRWVDRYIHPLIPEERRYGVSRVEREMVEFLRGLVPNEELVANTRSIITPYELDVYFPALGLAVEFNGDYWHSDEFLVPNHGMTALEYHRMKFDRWGEVGICLGK